MVPEPTEEEKELLILCLRYGYNVYWNVQGRCWMFGGVTLPSPSGGRTAEHFKEYVDIAKNNHDFCRAHGFVRLFPYPTAEENDALYLEKPD